MKDKRTDFRESFALRLKELMKIRKINQSEVARKINCSISIVSKWINRLREPMLSNICRLSELFGCSIDILVGKQPLNS